VFVSYRFDRNLRIRAVRLDYADIVHNTGRTRNGSDHAVFQGIFFRKPADARKASGEHRIIQREVEIICYLILQNIKRFGNIRQHFIVEISPNASYGVDTVIDAVSADFGE
jgi:hypothetical protein